MPLRLGLHGVAKAQTTPRHTLPGQEVLMMGRAHSYITNITPTMLVMKLWVLCWRSECG